MSIDIEDQPERTFASLESGIVADAQLFVEQHLELTRRQIDVEFRQHGASAVVFAIGMGAFFIDAIVTCLALVYLLH